MAASKTACEGKIAALYDLDRTLGKGHFAVVRLARHVFTGQLVAIKEIDKTKLDAMATGHLLQEVRCMKLVQHPNVVRLYEVIDTQTKLYLILELGDGGDMYDYILRHERGVSEGLAKRHFAQIVRAIAYCHRLHVVHRDLKPENVVFFREQGTVKITDFGFSNLFQPGTMLMTSCGSLAYSAPEILLGEEYDAPAVDIWSLGVILYMLVCGHPPFQEANDSETLTMIMDCRYSVSPHVSDDCKDLISRMLQRNPACRASLKEIEGHPWLQGVDPSPAGRVAVPLTSHRSLSQDEHEAVLQAMTSGNIADRDAIQEALEADRYNHITATYYLLGERILRDKQEAPGQGQEVECAWTEPQQLRSLSTPLDLTEEDGNYDPMTDPTLSAACKRAVEIGDGSTQRPPLLPVLCWEQQGLGGCLTPVKSIRVLQQICEEEEEEDEEEERLNQPSIIASPSVKQSSFSPTEPRVESVLAVRQNACSLSSETNSGAGMLGLQENRANSVLSVESAQPSDRKVLQSQGVQSGQHVEPQDRVTVQSVGKREDVQAQHTATSAATGWISGQLDLGGLGVPKSGDTEKVGSGRGEGGSPERSGFDQGGQGQREGTGWMSVPSNVVDLTSTGQPPSDNIPSMVPGSVPKETTKPVSPQGDGESVPERNNNTLPWPKLLEPTRTSSPGGSPRTRPLSRCVDLGPDGVECRGSAPSSGGPPSWAGGTAEREEAPLFEQSRQAQGRGGINTGPEPTAQAGQTKVKNVNLRERLLQFPLCEKALSFNIQPASKEKLMPFAQYNCCHVL